MSGETRELLATIEAWKQAGQGVAVATLVGVRGSSPLSPGARLAVAESGTFAGSVSGGCIEGAVIAEALEIIRDGTPRLVQFGIADDQAFAVGLACGGTVEIFIERVE